MIRMIGGCTPGDIWQGSFIDPEDVDSSYGCYLDLQIVSSSALAIK
jgi:hypothetical protein